MQKKRARPGPRGIEPQEVVDAALTLMEEDGPDGFSVRRLANVFGCDPMAVLYHFKSKAGLERAMADALNARVRPVDETAPWRTRLRGLASQYRALALAYPRTFPLLARFWITGPADHDHAEVICRALADAGFDDRHLVDTCFGWYASVLGLAAAEAGGLLKPATLEDLAGIERLSPTAFPTMTRLLPAFADQEEGRAYAMMVEIILDGIERAAASS